MCVANHPADGGEGRARLPRSDLATMADAPLMCDESIGSGSSWPCPRQWPELEQSVLLPWAALAGDAVVIVKHDPNELVLPTTLISTPSCMSIESASTSGTLDHGQTRAGGTTPNASSEDMAESGDDQLSRERAVFRPRRLREACSVRDAQPTQPQALVPPRTALLPDPLDLTKASGLFAWRPNEVSATRIDVNQVEQVIGLLGRRCVNDGSQKRGSRTLMPLVRRLVGYQGRSTGTTPIMPTITFGLQEAQACARGSGRADHVREVNDACIAELDVELLLALKDGHVQGAALLTKTAPSGTDRGFVVLQLIAVEETVEHKGVGSSLLDAACTVARVHNVKGSLLVPATSKWWSGETKAGWLRPAITAECTELRRMPCLFRMESASGPVILRWICNEARGGWLHGDEPPPADELAGFLTEARAQTASETHQCRKCGSTFDTLQGLAIHRGLHCNRKASATTHSRDKITHGSHDSGLLPIMKGSLAASASTVPPVPPKPSPLIPATATPASSDPSAAEASSKDKREAYRPWWSDAEGYLPPKGGASQFEVDSERLGQDGRMWRVVEVYEKVEGKGNGKRKRIWSGWMPLGEDHKLIKPEGSAIILASEPVRRKIRSDMGLKRAPYKRHLPTQQTDTPADVFDMTVSLRFSALATVPAAVPLPAAASVSPTVTRTAQAPPAAPVDDEPVMSAYELQRLDNIARNKQVLRDLGLE